MDETSDADLMKEACPKYLRSMTHGLAYEEYMCIFVVSAFD
jgi:hypothetical protein